MLCWDLPGDFGDWSRYILANSIRITTCTLPPSILVKTYQKGSAIGFYWKHTLITCHSLIRPTLCPIRSYIKSEIGGDHHNNHSFPKHTSPQQHRTSSPPATDTVIPLAALGACFPSCNPLWRPRPVICKRLPASLESQPPALLLSSTSKPLNFLHHPYINLSFLVIAFSFQVLDFVYTTTYVDILSLWAEWSRLLWIGVSHFLLCLLWQACDRWSSFDRLYREEQVWARLLMATTCQSWWVCLYSTDLIGR